MIVLVDIGNTQIKWATLTQGVFQFGHADRYQETCLTSLLSQRWQQLATPERILVSNVAGDAIAALLNQWTQQHWHKTAEFIQPTKALLGITNAYTDPQRLGADRWMGMIAAYHALQGPICIVSCGTAITIDAINKTGQHLGGLIVPGLELMRVALVEHTVGCSLNRLLSKPSSFDCCLRCVACCAAHLPDVNSAARCATRLGSSQNTRFGKKSNKAYPQQNTAGLGKNTEDAMITGSITMAAAFINHVTQQLITELTTALHCVITGGTAPILLPLLRQPYQIKPYLVLEGLAVIAREI